MRQPTLHPEDHATVNKCVSRVQRRNGETQEEAQEAFAILYRTFYAPLLRFCAKRLHGSGGKLAPEDAASETFTRALKNIEQFDCEDEKSIFLAWLYQIARNFINDYFGSGHYRKLRCVDAYGDQDQYDRLDLTPEDIVISDITYTAIRVRLKKYLERLAPDQRRCIELRFYRGLTIDEVAVAMGRQRGAVKSLQSRAIRNLARYIARESHDDL